jgi:hypothetical protein
MIFAVTRFRECAPSRWVLVRFRRFLVFERDHFLSPGSSYLGQPAGWLAWLTGLAGLAWLAWPRWLAGCLAGWLGRGLRLRAEGLRLRAEG